jgi:hypothetical protein
MKTWSYLLLMAQSLVLAACAVSSPDRAPVPTAAGDAIQGSSPPSSPAAPLPAHRPGVGVVESASVVSLSSSPSAAAGGSASSPTMGYRLRMEDGSTQNILHAGERFKVGDRVEVTSDGRLIGR